MLKFIKESLLNVAVRFRRLDGVITRLFIKYDGGEIKSEYLRKLYRKLYRMDVGLYTYGCFSPIFNFGGG